MGILTIWVVQPRLHWKSPIVLIIATPHSILSLDLILNDRINRDCVETDGTPVERG